MQYSSHVFSSLNKDFVSALHGLSALFQCCQPHSLLRQFPQMLNISCTKFEVQWNSMETKTFSMEFQLYFQQYAWKWTVTVEQHQTQRVRKHNIIKWPSENERESICAYYWIILRPCLTLSTPDLGLQKV